MKVFYALLSLGLFVLCGYLIFTDGITLPSRSGGYPSRIEPPATYLMALLPLSFGCASMLSVFDLPKLRRLIQVIVTVGVLALFLGLVFVAPLLKGQ